MPIRTTSLPFALICAVTLALSGGSYATETSVPLDSLRRHRDRAFDHGDHATALSAARALRRPSIVAGDGTGLVDDMLREADILVAMEDHGQASDALARALLLAGQRMDTAWIALVRYRLLGSLLDAGRHVELRRQLAAFSKPGPGRLHGPRYDLFSGRAHIAQHKPADALPSLYKALRGITGSTTGDNALKTEVILAMAEAETGLGSWQEALAHWEEANALRRKEQLPAWGPSTLELRSRIRAGMGDHAGALIDLRRSLSLRDSLLNGRQAMQLASLRAFHAVANDQEQLRSLKAEGKAAALEIGRQQEQINVMGIVAGTLLILLGALLIVGRKLRRSLQRERAKNAVIRRQGQEIQAKDIELGRQRFRLSETITSDEHKALLLKEIHHRVKNDLQITSTLLRIQACTSDDPRLMEWTRALEGRIRTMALVHESMYRFGDLDLIGVREHLTALVDTIVEAYGAQRAIALDIRIGEHVADAAELMPLSLLLHELMTNTLKHAFPTGSAGRITILYEQEPDGMRRLSFSHDGVGMERDTFLNGRSVGMELVRTLVAQLNGTIRMDKEDAGRLNVYYRQQARELRRAG